MCFDYGFGDGKADAVAAGGSIARFVRTVEAVEKTGDVGSLLIIACIKDFDEDLVLDLLYREADLAVIVGLLDRIIDQHGQHLLDGYFLADDGDVFLYVCPDLLAACFCLGDKDFEGLPHGTA